MDTSVAVNRSLLGGSEEMILNENQKQAIKELYIEMFQSLLAYAQSALNDRKLAEEAVQDTFRIACSKAEHLITSPNPRGWLLNTLKYVIKNMIRSRALLSSMIVSSLMHDNILLGDTDSPNVDLLYSELIDAKDYKLLRKVVLEKYTMLEMAQELDISVEACKKRVQRAKNKLKKLLG